MFITHKIDDTNIASEFHIIVGSKDELKVYTEAELFSSGDIVICDSYILACQENKNGKTELFSLLKLYESLAKFISKKNIGEVSIELSESLAKDLSITHEALIEHFVVEFGSGLYCFDQFKSEKKSHMLHTVNIFGKKCDVTNATIIVEALALVKDLGNSPSNFATPTYLADVATCFKKINNNVSVEIFDNEKIQELDMNAFWGVTKGSNEPAKFIKLEYKNNGNEEPIVLIGKGITFDSGGISLKPGNNMDDMKYDMCGAATVLGAFMATAKMQLPINLTVLVPACENMPSGHAQKPGDIVKTMSGKTVEILNTDAEGRLILCDALHYAKSLTPKYVIDLATLTGAVVVALGSVSAALYSNDEELAKSIKQASINSCDKVWDMPLDDEYLELIKGNHGDLLNIGGWGRGAGSITAAMFLREFIDYKWAHLDIAGIAYKSSAKGVNATGRPLKLLIELLRSEGNK